MKIKKEYQPLWQLKFTSLYYVGFQFFGQSNTSQYPGKDNSSVKYLANETRKMLESIEHIKILFIHIEVLFNELHSAATQCLQKET